MNYSKPIGGGGPAFPAIRIEQRGDPAYHGPTQVHFTGMTLRDWLAGQALAGLCASLTEDHWQEGNLNPVVTRNTVAAAFGVADAMLAARKGEQ